MTKIKRIKKMKNSSCKECIISVVCTEPCKKYYPDISILDTMIEYQRAMKFSVLHRTIVTIPINPYRYVKIFGNSINFYKDGKLHRDKNKPAAIYSDGYKEYWLYGIRIKKEKSSM